MAELLRFYQGAVTWTCYQTMPYGDQLELEALMDEETRGQS